MAVSSLDPVNWPSKVRCQPGVVTGPGVGIGGSRAADRCDDADVPVLASCALAAAERRPRPTAPVTAMVPATATINRSFPCTASVRAARHILRARPPTASMVPRIIAWPPLVVVGSGIDQSDLILVRGRLIQTAFTGMVQVIIRHPRCDMWSTSAAGQDPYFAEYISRSATLVHTGAVPSETDPSELRLGEVLDLVAGLVALGLITLIVADRSGLPRTLLALGFAFFVPGRAIVSNWPRMAAWSEAAIPIALKLSSQPLPRLNHPPRLLRPNSPPPNVKAHPRTPLT